MDGRTDRQTDRLTDRQTDSTFADIDIIIIIIVIDVLIIVIVITFQAMLAPLPLNQVDFLDPRTEQYVALRNELLINLGRNLREDDVWGYFVEVDLGESRACASVCQSVSLSIFYV